MNSASFFREQDTRTLPTTRDLVKTIKQQQDKLREQEVSQKKAMSIIQRQEEALQELQHRQIELENQFREDMASETAKNASLEKKVAEISEKLSCNKERRNKNRLPSDITVRSPQIVLHYYRWVISIHISVHFHNTEED